MECWWFESALAESPSGGMADTLDLKSNPTQGIGSSPMMGNGIYTYKREEHKKNPR